jgi:hypothetical protein
MAQEMNTSQTLPRSRSVTATCHRKTLNVTSPTDINPSTIHADAPPQAAIPDPKDRDGAAQMRGHILGFGSVIELTDHVPSM